MTTPFLAEAQELAEDLVAIRRDLHMHPELGFQEVRTARIVAEQLSVLGYEVVTGVGKTGVVGLLGGSQPGERTVLLRFDMDALPIARRRRGSCMRAATMPMLPWGLAWPRCSRATVSGLVEL